MAVYTAEHLPKMVSSSKDFLAGRFEKALTDAFLAIDEQVKDEEVCQLLCKIGDMYVAKKLMTFCAFNNSD